MSDERSVQLSIVTVCWNDIANVKRTLESVQMQTARDGWEHILVDGASTDGTADWYHNADFEFPHRMISEPDKGIFDAMNKSLDLVRGEYVVFMNAGDRLGDPGALERMLERTKNGPSWGYSRARTVDIQGRRVRADVGRVPYSRARHLLDVAVVCHQAVVMRTDLLRELGGFDLRMGNAADYHLLIKAGSRGLPATWTDVDVDYLAGGVSDRGVYTSLWLAHRCRVDALSLTPFQEALDSGWTALQVAYIWLRKTLKPVLRPIYEKLQG